MKIQSISGNRQAVPNYVQKDRENVQKVSIIQSNINDKNLLNDSTYNSVFVNFRGIPKTNPSKYPLEDKLSSLFGEVLADGDTVVIGRNLEQVRIGLKENVSSFELMFDRIFFIKDGGLSVPLAFSKYNDAITFIHNIGNKDVLISKDSGTRSLSPGERTVLVEDDVIINNKRTIPISFQNIKDIPFDILSMTDKFFTFIPSKIKSVKQFNANVLERLNEKESVKECGIIPTKRGLSFEDIGGLDNVIKQLKKGIVYPIKKPYAYKNAEINHGFLFYGPPGTGKTLLGKALANEINAKFYELNGLELEDSLVGSTEKKWRALFAEAKENQPSVLFIDEFDAVAKHRRGKDVYGDKVVNQLLTLITDIDTNNDKVFIITATNMPEEIDPAVIRPGRIGKHIEIPAPDEKGLLQIFDIHTKNKLLDENLDKKSLIKEFHSKKYTGADVRGIVADALDAAWERLGIYEKMEDDSLTESDIDNVVIIKEDFDKALAEFKPLGEKKRNPIGFLKKQ